MNELIELLRSFGFTELNETDSYIGNFHHHRFVHLKELEFLRGTKDFSLPLSQILGGKKEKNTLFKLTELEIFPADDDHRAVFKAFKEENCVIQGPPGTGKSQLLINFIGKLLIEQRSMVVVSEKRSALEVIEKKGAQLQLGPLIFLSSGENDRKEFILSLKESWNYFEELRYVKTKPVFIKNDLEKNLDLKLTILTQPNLIGNISFTDFQDLAEEISFTSTTYVFNKPDLGILQNHSDFIKDLFNSKLDQVLGYIQFSVFDSKRLESLNELLPEMMGFSEKLVHFFEIETWGDINKVLNESVVFTLFQNELVHRFENILRPTNRCYKKYVIAKNDYLAAKAVIDKNENHSEWKIIPSEIEIESLLLQLHENSFWGKRRLAKRWREISNIPLINAKKALDAQKTSIKWKEKLRLSLNKLSEFGVYHPEVEIQQIELLNGLLTEEKWNFYDGLSAEKIKFLADFGPQVERFRMFIKHYFNLNDSILFHSYLEVLNNRMLNIIPLLSAIKLLNPPTLNLLASSTSFSDFKNTLLGSHYTDFKVKYPLLAEFSIPTIYDEIHAIIDTEERESGGIANSILRQIKEQFLAYEKLLSTPAQKLNDEQKTLKKSLRQGKSILVKEFNKTRSHPSVRELYDSDAILWIQLLKPVWLSNTNQLATSFPLKKDLFDVCIMDEASQIPLEHSLGALFRSSRALIAGDSQQMGPSSYFKSNSGDSQSCLNQANYYFKKCELNHHYRSQHPSLISFSNSHFYNNQLTVFPSYIEKKENPIQIHYLPEGRFENRRNQQEAKEIAKILSEAIRQPLTIGLVAFSQEQIDAILEELPVLLLSQLEERVVQLTAFIKPLEKIQGDECEHLIISSAYGKNEQGEFHLRFGPLNRSNGRNRLNVLFSRASKKIDFITSIDASDLKLSTNESINLLRQWLQFISNEIEIEKIIFPLGLVPKVTGNELVFNKMYNHKFTTNEWITIQRVLTNRGWIVNYE
jgi:superfamily I DNA and/or RNA helicase/uncharacterized protein YqgQ